MTHIKEENQYRRYKGEDPQHATRERTHDTQKARESRQTKRERIHVKRLRSHDTKGTEHRTQGRMDRTHDTRQGREPMTHKGDNPRYPIPHSSLPTPRPAPSSQQSVPFRRSCISFPTVLPRPRILLITVPSLHPFTHSTKAHPSICTPLLTVPCVIPLLASLYPQYQSSSRYLHPSTHSTLRHTHPYIPLPTVPYPSLFPQSHPFPHRARSSSSNWQQFHTRKR